MPKISFDDLTLGGDIPPFTTAPISRHTLALYCGASGDHNPLHVDSDFAHAFGLPDVIAHGMLSAAYLALLLTNWLPQERLMGLSVRFAAMTHVGDELTCSGRVVEKEAGSRRVKLALTARNQAGEIKLSGEALVSLA